jgi:hypothetical protein
MKILTLDTNEKIVECISKMSLPEIFFMSPLILHTFLNKPGFNLYNIINKNNSFIFLRKEKTQELRLLFKILPEEFIEFLKKELDPPYIAYNELVEDPQKDNQIVDEEVFIDINALLQFEDGSIRRKYQSAQKNNDVIVKNFTTEDRKNLEAFWIEWATQRTKKNEKFVSHADHDKRFFDLYKDEDFFGKCMYDNGKLIGYTIGIKLTDTICLGAFNKVLRGYTQLGLQLFIERVKQAQSLGFKKVSIATINNDFKKQFTKVAEYKPIYAFELCRKKDFTTLSPNGYTGVLLR